MNARPHRTTEYTAHAALLRIPSKLLRMIQRNKRGDFHHDFTHPIHTDVVLSCLTPRFQDTKTMKRQLLMYISLFAERARTTVSTAPGFVCSWNASITLGQSSPPPKPLQTVTAGWEFFVGRIVNVQIPDVRQRLRRALGIGAHLRTSGRPSAAGEAARPARDGARLPHSAFKKNDAHKS